MSASGDSPALLKPSEVAARLHVSRSWLYDAAKAGLIPHIRLPSVGLDGREGPLRFVPEDLDAWIAEARANWTPGRHNRHRGHPGTRRRNGGMLS